MADTTTTTLTTAVPTELISATIIQEARPFNVVAPLVSRFSMPTQSGKILSVPKLPSTSASSVEEASDITATARTTTEANITVAEVGISTSLTKMALLTAKLPDQLSMWAQSAGRAIAQKVTGDLCTLFSALNGASAVGTSGTNITIANFIEAIYTLDNANSPGRKVAVLHPRQVADLYSAITSSTGTPFASLDELVRDGRLPGGTPDAGFVGLLLGVPVYSTTECVSANSSADVVGAMFCEQAMGYAQLEPVTVKYDEDASARTTEIVATIIYGVAELVDTYGVSIVTDA